MNTDDKQFTVRFDSTPDVPAGLAAVLRKFALAVSSALTALSKKIRTLRPATYVKGKASSPSLSMALLDPVTGQITFLPGVRFMVPGSNDVNVGFELDVSGAIGAGIGGTVQGYTANYGTLYGSKLTAGVMANNETPTIPRFDVGFKVQRGAIMEFYGDDGGGGSDDRRGQLRMTLGPLGRYIIYHNVSPNKWEVMGGFGTNHEFVCGFRGGMFPTVIAPGSATALPPFCVYGRTGSPTDTANYTKRPMATISDAGLATVKSLKIENGTNLTDATQSVTLTLTDLPADTDLVFQVKKVKMVDENDTPFTGYVLVSPTT